MQIGLHWYTNLWFNSQIFDFITIVPQSVPTGRTGLSIGCFQDQNDPNSYFVLVLAIALLPFGYILLSTIIFSVMEKKNDKEKKLTFGAIIKSKVVLCTATVIYIQQPQVLKVLFEMFRCTNVNTFDNPKRFLFRDLDVECWKSFHLGWALGLGIPGIIFCNFSFIIWSQIL